AQQAGGSLPKIYGINMIMLKSVYKLAFETCSADKSSAAFRQHAIEGVNRSNCADSAEKTEDATGVTTGYALGLTVDLTSQVFLRFQAPDLLINERFLVEREQSRNKPDAIIRVG